MDNEWPRGWVPARCPGLEIVYDGQWIAAPHQPNGSGGETSRRDDLLRELGWDLIVLTADDICLRPAETRHVVHKALLERGHPDVPAQLPDEWRAHFR